MSVDPLFLVLWIVASYVSALSLIRTGALDAFLDKLAIFFNEMVRGDNPYNHLMNTDEYRQLMYEICTEDGKPLPEGMYSDLADEVNAGNRMRETKGKAVPMPPVKPPKSKSAQTKLSVKEGLKVAAESVRLEQLADQHDALYEENIGLTEENRRLRRVNLELMAQAAEARAQIKGTKEWEARERRVNLERMAQAAEARAQIKGTKEWEARERERQTEKMREHRRLKAEMVEYGRSSLVSVAQVEREKELDRGRWASEEMLSDGTYRPLHSDEWEPSAFGPPTRRRLAQSGGPR